MALVKNFKFLHLPILGTFGLEKIFGDVLDRTLASLYHKIVSLFPFRYIYPRKSV